MLGTTDVDARNGKGKTPLIKAVQRVLWRCCWIRGADIGVECDGVTAAEKGLGKIAEMVSRSQERGYGEFMLVGGLTKDDSYPLPRNPPLLQQVHHHHHHHIAAIKEQSHNSSQFLIANTKPIPPNSLNKFSIFSISNQIRSAVCPQIPPHKTPTM